MDLADVPLDAVCCQCKRPLAPDAAFAADDQLYCGSCAPAGAVPTRVELSESPAAPSGPVPTGRPPIASAWRDLVGDLLGLKKK
ncbi:MAG: hypothetical protein JST54_35370 [Deltaproteobacteria bacterium]|nr:hypothetical protein [Deltaproteobacteria bacterium]